MVRGSRAVRFFGLLAGVCAATVHAAAQRLPVRCYDEAQGLVQRAINVVHQDGRGFLWIGTNEGLSRFDGYQFVNYGTREGLPDLFINHIAEDRRGRLWVATNGGGVVRLIDESDAGPDGTAVHRQAGARFRTSRLPNRDADRVNAIVFDSSDTLWAATDAGLYRARIDGADRPVFDAVAEAGTEQVTAAFSDSRGRLWFRVLNRGVLRIEGNRTEVYARPAALLTEAHLLGTGFDEDRSGTLRFALSSGVYELRPGAESGPGEWTPSAVGRVESQRLYAALSDSAGRLWLGTSRGLVKLEDGRRALIGSAHGLGAGLLVPMTEDRDGNLWVAGPSGLCRVGFETIVTYTAAEGLPYPTVLGVVEGPDGRIYANTPDGFVEIAGERALLVPGSDASPFRDLTRRLIRSAAGGWWVLLPDRLLHVPTTVLRFDAPAPVPLGRIADDGFVDPGTLRTPAIYEAPDGRLLVSRSKAGPTWITPRGPGAPYAEQATSDPLPPGLVPFFEDRAGSIWLASMNDLVRVRGTRAERIAPTPGLPNTTVRSLYQDRAGRLWIGLRAGGVSMTPDPGAETLRFVNYSTETGLASDAVWSITEDDSGRIYLATNRGLDRLDPGTGRIRHFTIADGLPGNYTTYCLRDSRGFIWVGTTSGLARLDPRAERSRAAVPDVYISRLEVAGEEYPVPETGSAHVTLSPPVSASRNTILIGFVGVSLGREHAYRYQYRVEGLDKDWSPPAQQRVVTYAQVPPGRFRFEARAVDWEGNTSARPAIVVFEVSPPFWRRWWFLALAVAGMVTTALVFHRLRLRQAVAMERVRRQVATDLHDDIGSGLAEIAILGEVARREAAASHLDEIVGIARSMRESMDDIVWAVDPGADRLSDVVKRIRQVAFNTLEADGMDVSLRAPDERELNRIVLEPDRRRHLLLIAKEAITNVARHARASQVEIVLEVHDHDLRLTVRDNGRGFAADGTYEGHGLRSMARRAEELGGHVTVRSPRGRGSVVEVRVPLR